MTTPTAPAVGTERQVTFSHLSIGERIPRGRITVPRKRSISSSDGQGVRVCVIDSGIDIGHPRFARSAIRRVKVITEPTTDVVEDDEPDTSGHGTACAGIILDVAPAAEVTSVRVLGAANKGAGQALLAGLRWAIDEQYPVVNLSLSTANIAHRDALHELCDRAAHSGVTLVSAANNRPVISYPWHFTSVISVGSHAVEDDRLIECNPRSPVDFFARGVKVQVPFPGGELRTMSGNSFAAPRIAGWCARILQHNPGLKPYAIKSALAAMAANVDPDPSEGKQVPA